MVLVNGFGVCLFWMRLMVDSGAHQILWARKNVALAIADLRGMLSFQMCDGRIPEMINWHAEKQGFLAHFLTRIQYSHTTYNDLTQMPVLPYRLVIPEFADFSVRAIYEQTNDTEFLKEVVPKVVKYVKSIIVLTIDSSIGGRRREMLMAMVSSQLYIHGRVALISVLHMIPHLVSLKVRPCSYPLTIGARARPSWREAYSPLIKLILQYNFIHGWDQTAILGRKHAPKISPFKSWFRVQDIAVNSVYASGTPSITH